MKKTDTRIQYTKARFAEAMLELIEQKPVSMVSVKELCDLAGINRGTFYLHYTDQFALLADVENEVYQKTLETLKNVKPAADAPGMIETFLNYIKSNASLFRILFVDADSEGFRSRFVQNMLNHLRFNIPLSCAAEEEPYLLCFLMQGSVHMIMEWIKRGFDMEPGQLAALIFRVCNRVAP